MDNRILKESFLFLALQACMQAQLVESPFPPCKCDPKEISHFNHVSVNSKKKKEEKSYRTKYKLNNWFMSREQRRSTKALNVDYRKVRKELHLWDHNCQV